jgi:hypothetical protein
MPPVACERTILASRVRGWRCETVVDVDGPRPVQVAMDVHAVSRRMAVAGADGRTRIHSISTLFGTGCGSSAGGDIRCTPAATLEPAAAGTNITSLRFSPSSGALLAESRLGAGAAHGCVRLYNAAALSATGEAPLLHTFSRASWSVWSTCWLDDDTVACGSSAGAKSTLLRVCPDGKLSVLASIKLPSDALTCAPGHSPHTVLVGLRNGTALLWDSRAASRADGSTTSAGEPLPGCSTVFRCQTSIAALHPLQAPYAVVTDCKDTAVLADVRMPQRRLRLYRGYTNSHRRFGSAVTADGDMLSAICCDRAVKTWDLTSGQLLGANACSAADDAPLQCCFLGELGDDLTALSAAQSDAAAAMMGVNSSPQTGASWLRGAVATDSAAAASCGGELARGSAAVMEAASPATVDSASLPPFVVDVSAKGEDGDSLAASGHACKAASVTSSPSPHSGWPRLLLAGERSISVLT